MPKNGAAVRRRAWIGAALIGFTLAVAAFIFFLDDLIAYTRGTATVIAILPGEPGLRPGSPVWIAGKQAGTVEEIGFPVGRDTEALIVATLGVSTASREQVRADATVRVTSARMIGEPAIEILPGSPRAPPLPLGDTVYAQDEVTFAELRASAAVVSAGIDSLAVAAAALAQPFARTGAALRRTLDHAEAARNEFATLARAARHGSLALIDDPALGRAIVRLRDAGRVLHAGLERSAPKRRELGHATRKFDARIARLVARLDTLAALQAGGTIARLGTDSAITVALRGVQAQLDSLIAEARANPLRFIF